MKISRVNVAGTGKVYGFTLRQMLKGRANLITICILLLFAFASVPVITVMMRGTITNSGINIGFTDYTDFYTGLDILPQQAEVLSSEYSIQIQSVNEYLEPAKHGIESRLGIQITYDIIVLILASFAASYIIQKVIEEKASKLVELLLVSVQPFAMLLGKILAVMTFVFGILLSMAAAFAISFFVTGRFMDTTIITESLAMMGITKELFDISPVTILILVISLLLSYFMTSFLSGLIGTGCSSTEDLGPANITVTLFVIVGYVITNSVAALDNPILSVAISLIPFVSMFAAPIRYLMGDISIWILMLSWLLQLIIIFFLAYVCAKIYRDLIMYRGSRIKISRLFSMLQQNRKAKEV